MTEQIPFRGVMDLDTPNEVFMPGCHKMARNIVFRGVPGNFKAENTPGTRLIAFDPPAGANECIGSYYDTLRQRVIWFNWNSNGTHGIYQMLGDEIATAITVCGNIDYLNFNRNPIHSVNILYGDQTIGDILFFIDSLGRPTKINIDRALAGGYGTMQRSFLDVAKEPPLLPPVVSYADDVNATVNNLRRVLFQFRYRWVFDDKDKSAWSTISEVPIPNEYLNPLNDKDATKNAQINLLLQTGDRNVKKIEIAGRQSIDNTYGNFFLITTVDKAKSSLADNAAYTYVFRNNNAADYINVPESNLLFDWVPKTANTQELLNGNIIIYGGIKEGYDLGIELTVSTLVDTQTTSTTILT